MRVLAIVFTLCSLQAGYSQCANGQCGMPQSEPLQLAHPLQFAPMPAPQFMPQFATAPKENDFATLRCNQKEPCIDVFDRRGEYLGSLWPREGTWQFAGKEKRHNLAEFVAKYHPPTGVRKYESAPPVDNYNPGQSSVTKPKPRPAVCECDGKCTPENCHCKECKCGADGGEVKKYESAPPIPDWQKNGINRDQIGKDGKETYRVNGREVTRSDAINLISAGGYTDGSIPDDKNNCRITVIGGPGERGKVIDDIKKMPGVSDKCVIQGYDSNHWRVRDGGFVTPKSPNDTVIYLQKANGEVLWRQDSYTGAENLYGALRDRIPGYDPARDPGPSPGGSPKPDGGGDDSIKIPSLKGLGSYIWVALIAAVAFIFGRRK